MRKTNSHRDLLRMQIAKLYSNTFNRVYQVEVGDPDECAILAVEKDEVDAKLTRVDNTFIEEIMAALDLLEKEALQGRDTEELVAEATSRMKEAFSQFRLAMWDLNEARCCTYGPRSLTVRFDSMPGPDVAIEITNPESDEPSGPYKTGAAAWFHLRKSEDGYTAYEYNVDSLMGLVEHSGVSAECGQNTTCQIIPLAEFEEGARRTFKLKASDVQVPILTLEPENDELVEAE